MHGLGALGGLGVGEMGEMSGVVPDGKTPPHAQIGGMHRLRTTLLLASATTAAALIGTGTPASAATVSRAADGALVLTAADGEKNRVGVQSTYDDPTKFVFYDSMAGTGTAIPDGCTRDDPTNLTSMTCANPPAIRVELGDHDDEGYISSDVKVPVTFFGGPGNDGLGGNAQPQTMYGGPGNDVLEGYEGDDALLGEDGADKVNGGAGSDRVDGGTGDDLVSGDGSEGQWTDLIDGGPGTDRIEIDFSDRSYDYVQPALNVTLGGGADDGRPGENDELRSVEKLIFNIPGTYTGTDADETLEMHQILGSVKLDGRGGNDKLVGADGPDILDGGTGDDDLDAGFGDDVITPGPGRDSVSADRRGGDCGPYWCKYPYGNDTVNAADGEVDSIDCGAGTDKVVADPADVVAPNCETVERKGGITPVDHGPQKPGDETTQGPKLTAKAVSPSAAARKGLKITITGLSAGQKVKLTAKQGKKIVAKGSGKATKSGNATVVLKFSKAGKRALAGKKRVTLQVSGAGAPTSVELKK